MSIDTCDPLLDALGDLGDLYPDMRFGQLIEMVAMLCGEGSPIDADKVEDNQLLEAASEHARLRRRRLGAGVAGPSGDSRPREERAELLGALQAARERLRDCRFGLFVSRLAVASGASLYDAEDSRLIDTARALTAR